MFAKAKQFMIIMLILFCPLLSSEEATKDFLQFQTYNTIDKNPQEITYEELYEIWKEIPLLYDKIFSSQFTKEEEQKLIEVLKTFLKAIAVYQTSELYTFTEIHDFPNHHNLSRLKQNVENLVTTLILYSENPQSISIQDLDKIFIRVQNDYINYTYHNTQEFNDSTFMLSLILVVFVISSIIIIFISLLYAHSAREKALLKSQIQEKEAITNIIVQVQEEERERISQEIHDTVLQDMRVEQFQLERLRPLIYQNNNVNLEKIRELFESILSLKKTSLKSITTVVRNLVPLEITTENYKQTLNDLVNKFTKDWELPCSFYAPDDVLLEQLSDTQKIHIYRIVQEAITNAVKHAQSKEIVVAVREDVKSQPNKLFIFITDDGCGMNIDQEVQKPEISTKLGLKGMFARSQIINAELEIFSDEETGTQVTLSMEIN